MRRFRKTIGFLWPCDGLNDQEYWKFLPNDVSWLTARYGAETGTEELSENNLQKYSSLELLRQTAKLFPTAKLDSVACGDHAASFIFGKKHEDELIDGLKHTFGCPVSFPSNSIVKLIKSQNTKNISLISPYSETVTKKFQEYLLENSIETLSSLSLNFTSEEQVDDLSTGSLSETIVKFTQDCKHRTDLLVIAGGGVTISSEIPKIEVVLGIPIITAVGALVRDAIQSTGHSYSKKGVGVLFEKQKIAQPTSIREKLSTGTKTFSLTDTPPIFRSGAGPILFDDNQKQFIDFASGSGTTSLGHGHEEVIQEVKNQLDSGIFHIGPHFHTEVQSTFYSTISELLPPIFSRFHPSISGSEATEVAIKSVMHKTGAKKFVGFSGGYHGRTFGSLSVSGEKGKNSVLGPFFPECEILTFPEKTNTIKDITSTLDNEPLAGIIIEPIQATAGLRFVNKDALVELRNFTKIRNIPLIFDETFTGFCRTGKTFGFSHYDVLPDVLIFGKSLAAGFPAGLVASTEDILTSWQSGSQSSTFQLGPIAASASIYFLNQIKHGIIGKNVERQNLLFQKILGKLQSYDCVVEIRGIGSFWVIEFDSPETNQKVRKLSLTNGLITWECGQTGECLGLVPPLNADPILIEKGCEILKRSVMEVLEK